MVDEIPLYLHIQRSFIFGKFIVTKGQIRKQLYFGIAAFAIIKSIAIQNVSKNCYALFVVHKKFTIFSEKILIFMTEMCSGISKEGTML